MAFKIFSIIFLLLTFVPYGHGELRDPTRPDLPIVNNTPTQTTAITEPNIETKLTLSEIWISSYSRRAVINGIKVKPGDTFLNNILIVAINENRVTIKEKGLTKTLHLHQRSYTPR